VGARGEMPSIIYREGVFEAPAKMTCMSLELGARMLTPSSKCKPLADPFSNTCYGPTVKAEVLIYLSALLGPKISSFDIFMRNRFA
jgi:hypothetical protein